MKRVLVTGASNIGKAGVATIVYKWGQQFDPSAVVYDYLMQRGLPDKEYQDAIEKKGGKIYTLNEDVGMFGIIRWITHIVESHGYETIHINSDSAYIATAYIYAAKRGGIKNIYVHSHCTQIDANSNLTRLVKTILHKICMPYVCGNSKRYLACSELAGQWMFGNRNVRSGKYQTIYNGVEPERYRFDVNVRLKYRESFGLEDKTVIANIGRFSYQKNHSLLIDIFNKYLQNNRNSILMLIGDGELKNDIERDVRDKGISEHVMFLGIRNDVPALLSAMDVLVMPSRFEGLPVTMVEAQMASLPCVVSSNITQEAKFTENVVYVNGCDTGEWSKAIMEEVGKSTTDVREMSWDQLNKSHFNIKIAANELADILVG